MVPKNWLLLLELTLQDLLQTYWSGKGYYERRMKPSVGGRPNKKRNDENFERHQNEVVKHEASRMASNAQPLKVSLLLTLVLLFLPGLTLIRSFWDSEVSVAKLDLSFSSSDVLLCLELSPEQWRSNSSYLFTDSVCIIHLDKLTLACCVYFGHKLKLSSP